MKGRVRKVAKWEPATDNDSDQESDSEFLPSDSEFLETDQWQI